MGSSDEAKTTNRDWASMQAYYGSGVAVPPYYHSPGYLPPPYMWGPPQPMMPPYGTPYAAIYPHGGVYAHPAVPIASPPFGFDTPQKSSATTDRGLMKKLKGFDGLVMSIGNANADKTEGEAENRLSHSSDSEGSNEGSDGNTGKSDQNRRKRSPEGTPSAEVGNGKPEAKAGPPSSGQINSSVTKVLGVPVTSVSASGSLVGTSVHVGMERALDLKNRESHVKENTITAAPTALGSSEAWMQNERELKRERRKQSNRESARRSRLRKQAETEELARKVETLMAENRSLKSEINQLTHSSENLTSENVMLTEKLKSTKLGLAEGITFSNIDTNRIASFGTENLLSRVDNHGTASGVPEEGVDVYEKSTKSGAKLHQLLDVNPRADAMAAG